MGKGTAVKLTTLWATKKEGMYTAELDALSIIALGKAAQVACKTKIKFLAFMGMTEGGRHKIEVLAEPCDPYLPKTQDGQDKPIPLAHW